MSLLLLFRPSTLQPSPKHSNTNLVQMLPTPGGESADDDDEIIPIVVAIHERQSAP